MKRFFASLFLFVCCTVAQAANPVIEMRTNQGTILLELFADKAPKSVENFLEYAKSGHYNGTIFHRVIDGFMIQGGGFDGSMSQKPTRAPIENEAKNGLRNETGTLAMARTSAPHSATSQFFINLIDNSFLDYPSRDGWGYAVFGKVTSGMDVVQKIGKTRTGVVGGMPNVPAEPIVIESVRLIEAAKTGQTK
ncbi:MAG: peptidyl-prolyl cis-trans isomerase A (cyclophilin A) [Azoarcus sp.]|uniref:Peptidyl-prolyl cis-trans isomerase n=1 Tax=Aromatoleum tolulyticum TaxID=34027 RepID=A0A1N6RBE3_9RHOO|nr:peptidylprolyl isomerase [Aromatoleum tolulyticum]MCK9984142.1 peptidyl-prolyl cis-trans isomerase A (cyclophilin A) [Azoarcus sp.]SIQ26154.1 peptidyl-prolyl cis-trans isomerase A (cyclophilin A) [Aromatoleum tolulyticum]